MNPIPDCDLVIFDCDGVLIDSEVLSCTALIHCLRRYGIEMDLGTAFERFLGQTPQAVGAYCAAQARPLPASFFAELRLAVRNAFEGALSCVPDARRVLESLRVPYCVASSSDLERMGFALQLAGLLELVDGRLFSAEMVRQGKPAPDLFLYAAARMGAPPERTLVIEDSVSGVAAGKSAGMAVWGFIGGSHYEGRDGRALLNAAGADRVFAHMAEF